MIQAIELSKTYNNGQKALSNLNLSVEAGQVYALLGSNGAGKSTTINLFMGFLEPSSGKALINGQEVSRAYYQTRHWVAYIPEVVRLYPYLSALENLDYFSRLSGFSYTRDKLQAFLLQAGLQQEAHGRRVGHFSKGMRQKVGIAIALAKQAKAIFMDEPTSGLDPHAANEFSQLIQQLSEHGVSILMATHDLFRAKESAHRVGIMHGGHLLHEQSTYGLSTVELESMYLELVRSFTQQLQSTKL